MDDNSRAGAVFKLMQQIREGDAQAQQQLRDMADDYFEFPGGHNYLLTMPCEVENARKCFVASGKSFFIPDSFGLKDVQLDGGVYSFFAKDGRVQTATLTQLERIWDPLPWGGDRVTADHVERAFLNCHRECSVTELICPPIGVFQFDFDYFYAEECRWQDRRFSVFVHVRLADDFDRCVAPMLERFNAISEFDAAARNGFVKELGATEEDLNAITLDQFDFYIDGEFDITYGLPGEGPIEYVRACFSSDQKLVEVTFGNY